MKSNVVVVIAAYLAVVVVAVSPASAQHSAGSTPTDAERRSAETAIRAQLDEVIGAIEDVDVERMMSYGQYDASLPFLVYLGRAFPTEAAARGALESMHRGLTAQTIDLEDVQTKVLTSDTAITTVTGQLQAESESTVGPVIPFAWTVLWTNENGRWKLIHAHQSVPRR